MFTLDGMGSVGVLLWEGAEAIDRHVNIRMRGRAVHRQQIMAAFVDVLPFDLMSSNPKEASAY